jgi:hypothetical protein
MRLLEVIKGLKLLKKFRNFCLRIEVNILFKKLLLHTRYVANNKIMKKGTEDE